MRLDQDFSSILARNLWLGRMDQGTELHLHAGVEPAPAHPADGGEVYVLGSWLPRVRSRPVTAAEFDELMQSARLAERLAFGLVRVPGRVIRLMADNAHAIWNDDGTFWTDPPGRVLLDKILSSSGLTSEAEVRGLGPNRRPPGLRSTTVDQVHGFRIGLHIDSWDAKRLSERGGARNRFCLNLGGGTHYLFIVPLSAADILARIGATDADAMPPDLAIRKLFQKHPNIPILRLAMPPGYGYVAPTDAVIHDGGAASSSYADIVITWLGQFGFRPEASADAPARVEGW